MYATRGYVYIPGTGAYRVGRIGCVAAPGWSLLLPSVQQAIEEGPEHEGGIFRCLPLSRCSYIPQDHARQCYEVGWKFRDGNTSA
jgi:hypothetical protein